jgi:purine-nucleoside phosphorylase
VRSQSATAGPIDRWTTRVDGHRLERCGDYVIMTVRDPLCACVADPAKQIAERLENASQIGMTGLFSSWSGLYKGASVTVVSGGSGAPEAELALYEFLENTGATAYISVGGSAGMHAPAIVATAQLFGHRGGSVCSVADNIVTGQPFEAGAGHDDAVTIALEGVAVLCRTDDAKRAVGSSHWAPSLGLAPYPEKAQKGNEQSGDLL